MSADSCSASEESLPAFCQCAFYLLSACRDCLRRRHVPDPHLPLPHCHHHPETFYNMNFSPLQRYFRDAYMCFRLCFEQTCRSGSDTHEGPLEGKQSLQWHHPVGYDLLFWEVECVAMATQLPVTQLDGPWDCKFRNEKLCPATISVKKKKKKVTFRLEGRYKGLLIVEWMCRLQRCREFSVKPAQTSCIISWLPDDLTTWK